MFDPMMYLEQHVNVAAAQLPKPGTELPQEPAQDNDLVAQDAAQVCGRCDHRIRAGQPMRRRASGGWAHENC